MATPGRLAIRLAWKSGWPPTSDDYFLQVEVADLGDYEGQGTTADREDSGSRRDSDPAPGPDEDAPLYRRLRTRGIEDPGLLERAAAIDRAAADVMQSAGEDPIQGNTAARLAAMDGTPGPKQPVSVRAAVASRPGEGPARKVQGPRSGQGTRSRHA